MPLHSRGHRRACDQGAVVKKRDPLVYYRDDDLERALRKGLGPSALRRFRVCLPVMVLVFVRRVLAWPERVLGSKQKLSVCDPAGIMKMANTAVVIARCIAGNPLANIARSHSRDSIVSRRCAKRTPGASSRQRAKPLLQIWSQWVENWTVLTITV